jgi:precorrin-6B methylase 2
MEAPQDGNEWGRPLADAAWEAIRRGHRLIATSKSTLESSHAALQRSRRHQQQLQQAHTTRGTEIGDAGAGGEPIMPELAKAETATDRQEAHTDQIHADNHNFTEYGGR